MRNFKTFFLLLTFYYLFSIPFIYADELPELKSQMQKIQEENKALQEQLDKQREVMERLARKIETLESKDEDLSKEVKTLKERPMPPVFGEGMDIGDEIGVPEFKMKGFSDIGFTANINDNEDTNGFGLGSIELFITSEITDRVSFLAAPKFHFNADTNSSTFQLERASLKYSFSDIFNIKIGRIHTPLGYWNTSFHHGSWLETTVFRPEIYLWEDDDGGFLPLHSVGVEFYGTKEFNAFELEYNIDVANGRGRTIEETQTSNDKNDSKAVNVLFSVMPRLIDGLKLGVNAYIDTIPSNPGTATRTERIDELIFGGYVAYLRDRVEILAEAFNIHHDDKTSGQNYDTLGFYLQGAYKIDKFTPYYRFDFIDFGNNDPYFTPLDIDIKKHTLGLRWDVFTWNAIKFEYSFAEKQAKGGEHSVTVNSSFVF